MDMPIPASPGLALGEVHSSPQTRVLARKYRPALFRDVVGQDIFVQIARNSLASGRISQAILLTGIRGVGKTTLARLIAKALCCAQRQDDQEPCGQCISCHAIAKDTHMDIVEMDAASHTGVEDMRQILDACLYRPTMGAYKIFIIDEVHMLSKSAFNALLKTLEEPPAHVVFILATTDVHKVPATILSRCRQMHLHRFSQDALAKHLGQICQNEQIQADPDALQILAAYSQGSARDGLMLLERALVALHPQTHLKASHIQDLLGLPPQDRLETVLDYLLQGQGHEALACARDLYHQGIEPASLFGELMRLLHGRICAALGAHQPLDHLDRLFQIALHGLDDVARAPFAWMTAEMVLLRMAYVGRFPTPSQILLALEGTPAAALTAPSAPKSAPLDPSPPPLCTGMNSIPVSPVSDSAEKCLQTAHVTPTRAVTETPLPNEMHAVTAPDPHLASPAPAATDFLNQSLTSMTSILHAPSVPSVHVSSPSDPRMPHWEEILQVLQDQREGLLWSHMAHDVVCHGWQGTQLHLFWKSSSPRPATLTRSLEEILGIWLTPTHGRPSIVWQDQVAPERRTWKEDQQAHAQALWDQATQTPLLQDMQAAFPGLILEEITQVCSNGKNGIEI